MFEIKSPPSVNSPKDASISKTGRAFYGWWIVLAGTVILFVSYGTAQSYRLSFTIFAAMSVLAILMICFAEPPGPDTPESTKSVN